MSEEFAQAARQLELRRSVGRTGVCYDNAQAETFNSAVKVERVNRTHYPTREHARKDPGDSCQMGAAPLEGRVERGCLCL
jgi:transposase InsO family protein